MKERVSIFWFRRDLRLDDNAALYHALRGGIPVVPIFIFDRNILDKLEDRDDARVSFIHHTLLNMQQELEALGSSLEVYHGTPEEVFAGLLLKYAVHTVFTNHDYEAYARQRDPAVCAMLERAGTLFKTFKDHVIFEKGEVCKDNGEPYSVFTPYSRKWIGKLNNFYLKSYPVKKYHHTFRQQKPQPFPTLSSMGFTHSDRAIPANEVDGGLVKEYDRDRDYPGRDATSRVGIHLRFGTRSIRELARTARDLNKVYLSELIWRDFYQMILWHNPAVGEEKAFKPAYDRIRWRNNEKEFALWCEGKTGYPIVDAGMRQLNTTGFMHNRVRMIVASFLCKHLLIDWRWGEAYFARQLLDYDFASNNGGWQWASGSGCDAAPYFRVFNPTLQMKRFDGHATYIKTWVPEFGSPSYPQPVVDHEAARERCLTVYRAALRQE